MRQPDDERSRLLPERISGGKWFDPAAFAAVKKQFDIVRLRHSQGVFDHHASRHLVQNDPSSMHHRIGKPHIAILPTLEQVRLGRT